MLVTVAAGVSALAVVVGRDHEGVTADFYLTDEPFSLLRNHAAFVSPARMHVFAALPDGELGTIVAAWESLKSGEEVEATHRLNLAGVWSGALALAPVTKVAA